MAKPLKHGSHSPKCKCLKLAKRMVNEEVDKSTPKNVDAMIATLFKDEQSCRIFVRTLLAINFKRLRAGDRSECEFHVANELAHQFYHWKE